MGTTTNHNLRYPEDANAVAVPADVKKLADDVDAKLVSSAGGTVSGNISFTGTTIVQTPTANNHAANKSYVDTQDGVINTELGTNPSGTFSTVVQRLDSYTDGFNKVGNLLTANQASPTTTGAFAALNGCTEGSAGVFTAADSSPFSVRPDVFTVSAGETVTALATVATVGRTSAVLLDFRDAGGANIGGYPSGPVVAAGTTGDSRLTTVAPAGAATVRVFPVYTGSGAGGDTVTLMKASFHRGAAGVWQLPGVPIPGQSRIAVNNAVDLSGTGVPTGRVSAAPGSSFLQIGDAVTVSGNLLWRKATGTGNTGWEPEGALADTGWRDVSASINADWKLYTVAGLLRIRRVGGRVTLLGRLSRVVASGSRTAYSEVLTLEVGFRTETYSAVGAFSTVGSSGVIGAYSNTNALGTASVAAGGTWAADNGVDFEVSWNTPDAWPASLPGSAA